MLERNKNFSTVTHWIAFYQILGRYDASFIIARGDRLSPTMNIKTKMLIAKSEYVHKSKIFKHRFIFDTKMKNISHVSPILLFI